MLCAPITKIEIYRIINDMALNKTPGVDGIPIEFYIENWNVLSDDLIELYSTVLQTGCLSNSQRKGIIIIIPKSKDTLQITNYRPISLLCVDYKILSKLLYEIFKKVLLKIIHNKQFCGVPGRSINQCNMELRDVIHYANDCSLDMAI